MASDDDAREHAYRDGADYLADRAAGLFASVQDGTPSAVEWLRRWDAPPTPEGARMALARAHGFPSWAAMESPATPVVDPDDPFVRAFHAIENRRPDVLGELITASPALVSVRGTNGNHLLGIATAQGDPRAVGLLLAAGADPGRGNVHGWAPLHQAAYMGRPDLAGMLLAAGAPPGASARGDGGTPLVMALFWGHPVPSALVDEVGLAPGTLRAAAGLGLTGLIRELEGTPAAVAGRGFYRPHGGFPAWRPTDDPAEARDEAVAWAARSDQPDAIETLVALGADPSRDVYRGTPLAWAAALGRMAALRRLLDLGVDPSGPTTFGGPDHGEGVTPLHLAASDGQTGAIAALLEAGADPSARDGRHGGTPADWARHAHQADAGRLLDGR
ncbi:MAG TPA: ankyrin repeat domain-containing protein [Miltoncostaeaceae bacterium]|nr:ankyrin repeat domain-containing protein [Miltoncostaeaceae bacterium]